MNSDFMEQFIRHKNDFLKELTRGNIEVNFKTDNNADSKKIILELFEQWLLKKTDQEQLQPVQSIQEDTQSFDVFLDDVLFRAKKILSERGIKIAYTSLSNKIGITESWKCIRVFGSSNIYYRIGKTRPRKGPYKGQEYLVIDLVMDGNKKQVFVPLLKKKDAIENQLGTSLERELPKVEATGKYRLKLMLPYDVIKERNKRLAAKKLADFVEATKPHLNELGVV
ncbi:hypothetical protein [Desulfoscipio sp. XC116]|uniref:hypothetical protein n=1 Tax=Desulfoscipio sp. XC116 TaxID=3144975 RepID=UPI00325AC200